MLTLACGCGLIVMSLKQRQRKAAQHGHYRCSY
nr:MAG TPA: hypothetical protein [Caudoviricetes sp.]